MQKTLEQFQIEYDRLFKWRELWTRLSNRKPKTWRGTLQVRDEAVQRRAKIADTKIRDLMREYDETRSA